MNINTLVNQIKQSEDMTVIAPRNVIADIIMGLGIDSKWIVSINNFDINDDNILLLTKLGKEYPSLVIERAISSNGKLVDFIAKEFKIEKSCFDTFVRLDVVDELRENIESFCIFDSNDFE